MNRIFALLSIVLWAASPVFAEEPGRLTVTGQGVHDQAPDMATITMGVTTGGRTAAKALRDNSAATAAMIDVVVGEGIDAKDIQTSNLSLNPTWQNRSSSSGQPPEISGYTVYNTVTVTIFDLEKLGTVLDKVVSSGANQFSGLQFGLQSPTPGLDIARERAVKDALRKAELYATAAGFNLGQVLEFNENMSFSPQPMMMREMAVSDAVPIVAGELSQQATVTVVYAIRP